VLQTVEASCGREAASTLNWAAVAAIGISSSIFGIFAVRGEQCQQIAQSQIDTLPGCYTNAAILRADRHKRKTLSFDRLGARKYRAEVETPLAEHRNGGDRGARFSWHHLMEGKKKTVIHSFTIVINTN